MRAILMLIGIVVLGVVVMMSLGMLRLDQTSQGALPTVSFNGGQMPEWKAKTGKLDVGTTEKTVRVPTVGMTNATVQVPVVRVQPASNAATPASGQ